MKKNQQHEDRLSDSEDDQPKKKMGTQKPKSTVLQKTPVQQNPQPKQTVIFKANKIDYSTD